MKSLHAILKKIGKVHIILAEAIVLGLLIITYIVRKQGAPESLDTGVSVTDFSSNHIVYDNGWSIGPDSFEEGNETIDMLYGPFITLPKGDYTIVISYNCDEKQSARPYSAGSNIHYIRANTIDLDPHLHSVAYDIRITEPVDDFEIRVYYNGQGNFSINDIRIYRNLYFWKRTFFILFFFFILADICMFNYGVILQNKKEAAYLVSIVFLLSLPLFMDGVGYGLDTDFHLMRVEGICSELRRGVFPVRLQPDWLYGNGYPTSIYYGDLLLYFPAIMRLMGFTVTQAYESYIFLINVLTVCTSFFSFNIMVKNKNISVLMTLAYCTSTYRLMTVVFRDALGEYTAAAFMPMVAAAVYLIYTDVNDTIKPDVRKASVLAVAMSLIILSHTLSTEMVTVVLFIFCIINIRKTIKIRTLLTLVVAVIETLMLSLYFLVPFVDYYINMDVASTHGVKDDVLQIQGSGASILDMFIFYKDPFFEGWSLTPGAVLLASLIFSIFLSVAGKTDTKLKMMTVFSLAVLFLASDLCPWNWLAYHSRIWNALSVVEFPNRYITLSGVLLAVLMGFLLQNFWDDATKRFRLNTAAVIISLSVAGALVMYHYYDKNIITYNCIDSADVRTDVLLGGDFSRVDKDGEPIDHIRTETESENAEAETLSQEGSAMEIQVKTADVPGVIKTPYFNYKGYRATDSEGNELSITDDEYCKVSFVVPAHYDCIIKVDFTEPWYWRVSEFVSLAAWIGLIIYFVIIRSGHRRLMNKAGLIDRSDGQKQVFTE